MIQSMQARSHIAVLYGAANAHAALYTDPRTELPALVQRSCQQLYILPSAELSPFHELSSQVLLCKARMLRFECWVYRWLQT